MSIGIWLQSSPPLSLPAVTDRFAARLGDRGPLVGVWSVVGHPAVAEVLATAGFDFMAAGTDVGFLREAAGQYLSRYRAGE
jgi:2-keto-3-deoxy-L-rhamnonate aldolase RhmA